MVLAQSMTSILKRSSIIEESTKDIAQDSRIKEVTFELKDPTLERLKTVSAKASLDDDNDEIPEVKLAFSWTLKLRNEG